MTIDVGRAISYIFADERWLRKVGLGTLIMMVPILNFAGLGYEMNLIRQVAQGQPRPLPEWDNVDALFRQGWRLGVAYLIYAIPLVAGIITAAMPWVVMLLVAIVGKSLKSEWIGQLRSIAFFLAGLTCCGSLGCVGVLSLGLSFLRPAIALEYLRYGTLRSCFAWGTMLSRWRAHWRPYLLVVVITWLVGNAAGIVLGLGNQVMVVLSWIPFIVPIGYLLFVGFVSMYIFLISAHLEGQLLAIIEAPGTPATDGEMV